MNTQLAQEAQDFGAAARAAFERVAGDHLAASAVNDPASTDATVMKLLAPLGIAELDLSDDIALEAACALMEAAGRFGLSTPLGARLAAYGIEAEGLAVMGSTPTLGLGGLNGTWRAARLDGSTIEFEPARGRPLSSKDPRIVRVEQIRPMPPSEVRTVALAMVLDCWGLLGTFSRALELACDYARDRQQFGQALGRFQGVQFALTDAEVERAGVAELARYSVWSLERHDEDEALIDALALRLAALEAGRKILGIVHQVHGAIGFCDETFVSWLSRNADVPLALPLGISETTAALSESMGVTPLRGLFTTEEASR